MDLNQKIIAGLLLAFFLITLLRVLRAPLRLALRLLGNAALGFAASAPPPLSPASRWDSTPSTRWSSAF